jgi:hypothetical protein
VSVRTAKSTTVHAVEEAKETKILITFRPSVLHCLSRTYYARLKTILVGFITLLHITTHPPSDHTMALGSTRPLTEMGTRATSGRQ